MNPVTFLMRAMVKGYQWFISPVLPASCRHYPSCSSYMLQALELHGPLKGGWMGLKRISRCHPWNDGGFDPVPGTEHHHQHTHTHTHGSCGCSPDAKV